MIIIEGKLEDLSKKYIPKFDDYRGRFIEGLTPEEWYGNFREQRCVRTSYNGNIRKNYAGIGSTYDEERDAFIAPKPFDSWILNEETCQWEAPIPYPTDGLIYVWNNNKTEWEEQQ